MSVLQKAITALDPTPDKTKQLSLVLALITELAEQKVKQFSTDIETSLRNAGTDEGKNKTVPVTNILGSHTEYRAYVKSDAQNIPNAVTEAVQQFFEPGAEAIVGGITQLIQTAVTAILGGGIAGQEEKALYYLQVQDFAIIRYDVRLWARSVEAEGITQYLERVLAVAAYKSAVDVSKIPFNTFLALYGQQLRLLNLPPDQVKEFLSQAKELFGQLGGAVAETALLGDDDDAGTTDEIVSSVVARADSGELDRFAIPGEESTPAEMNRSHDEPLLLGSD